MTKVVDYIVRARDYLKKLGPSPKGEPEEGGLNERQLDILGRIASLTDRKGLVLAVFPDEWILPCNVDDAYPNPHLWFLIELNPNTKKRGNKRTVEGLTKLVGSLGLPSDSVKSVYEDEGHDYGFEFDKEGINWEALIMLREESRSMREWKKD